MSLAGLLHRNNYLCRKLTQIHNALEGKDKTAFVTGLSFPSWLCLFHSWKWTVVVKLRLWILHTSSVLGLPACSDLRVISCMEGMWRKREAFKKDLSTRRAFHLASARSSAWWSMLLLLTNLLPGPEPFNKSWTDGSVRFSWFPASGAQGSFYHKVFLGSFQWNSRVLCSCYC